MHQNSTCCPKVWWWMKECRVTDAEVSLTVLPSWMPLLVLLSLMYPRDWITLVNKNLVKFLHRPSQFTSSINKKFFSPIGRMREGLFSSSTSHKPADYPVLHDANDWNAPINQQRGYWIHPGCTDSREKWRRCQKAFSWSDRGLQR